MVEWRYIILKKRTFWQWLTRKCPFTITNEPEKGDYIDGKIGYYYDPALTVHGEAYK
jgi:hypothetical protein